ncbi:alpha,alpha-trehalase TreA [Pseudomonas aeruginosa]|nr:alpha,alpha-trehalase TreA [Pseudomonas aeruginosa]
MPDRTALPRAMLAAWVLLLLAACSQGPAPTPPASSSWGWQDASGERAIAPDEAYPELFQAVQESRLFSDQKHFVDALPLREPARIRADYLRERERPGFDLRAFVGRNFEESGSVETAPPEAGADLASHISDLWPALTRHYEQVPAHSSLLPLPKPYVVPGGRFREVYYWDSYFTMLGLAESGQHQRVRDMLDNFAYLIDTYGHIPNGNRSYYLSRSQPPFFAYMVDLQARREGDAAYRRYLPQLQKEYAYWMEGSAGLRPNEARLHVVKLADGSLLNRYWDNRDTPRQESFLEDRATAARAPQRPAGEVYRDLRAGAESGWDFSSRWLDDDRELASIRTTAIVPVDLNALLYHLERTIAKACASSALKACEQGYGARAEKRRQAIEDHLWHPAGYYADYDWQRRRPIERINAASLFPLFTGLASTERAGRTADSVAAQLLRPGGLATTTRASGQQWDEPNGWAPLQWVAVQGLRAYGRDALAEDIGRRFLAQAQQVYDREGKLVEKYDISGNQGGGGGGEYPLQDGFGWSNGVTLQLLRLYGPGAGR